MGRAQNKHELISSSNENYDKLIQLVKSLNQKELETPFDFSNRKDKESHWKRDKNVRDVIVHLYEWHVLQLDWILSNLKGISKNFLPEPYTWRSYSELNVHFWKKHQYTSLDKALQLLASTHQEMIDLAFTFSDDELFSSNIFNWTGGSKLGAYFVSTMASHYDWGIKKIKIHKKNLMKEV